MCKENTYGGLHVFGSVLIIAITNPMTPMLIQINNENDHFLINGQFQFTNGGILSVHVIMISPTFVTLCLS